jgi:chromosome partitioning protein
MIITITSFKGGVAKTTTAVHLACYLQKQQKHKGDVLLIDGDPNRSCLAWSKRGGLPFKVVDEKTATKHIKNFEHVIIDTPARPQLDELEALAEGCDILLLPTTPDALAIDALSLTVEALSNMERIDYRVLLTIIPPKPTKDGEEAREVLSELGLPVMKSSINRMIVFQRAALQGVPVYEVKDKRAEIAWGQYKEVGKELLN